MLTRFAIGTLGGAHFEQIALHVTECSSCADALAELDSHADDLVSALGAVPNAAHPAPPNANVAKR